ncbi:hypothetical protein HN51_002308 [Arachis hypogaea]|uniref:class V chitinase n=1 Tax=Arachis hypogaea TaxID=3818 RepID=UPI000DEC7B97|nr:class V chitinase [Arachis hypogaea]
MKYQNLYTPYTKKKTMANSNTLSLSTFTIIVLVLQLNFFSSNAEAAGVKGGYWYYDSGLDASAIDSSYFTHLFCAFADLDSNTNKITLPSSTFSTFTQTVQKKNPAVKTLLSIGGGGGPTLASKFSTMAKQNSSRKTFIDSSIQVARANNFHGLDLDWEYPNSNTDKTNLGFLLNEWRAAIKQEARISGKTQLLLSGAVSGSNQISPLQYYPAQAITNNMDWINVMVYDLFIPDGYRNSTQPPAPLYNPTGIFSGSEGINVSWINQLKVPPNKLAIGLPFYGYAWTLVNANVHGLFAGANGAGSIPSGGSTPVYRDIRSFINNGAQTVYNSTYVTNYCYSGTTWVGYDDTQSVSSKVSYAKSIGLIGYFAWQVGGDDNNWTLSKTASSIWGP